MHCRVDRPTPAEVEAGPVTESAPVRLRVEKARDRQADRFDGMDIHCNGQLDGAQTRRLLKPPAAVQDLLNEAYRRKSLSLRGYDRSLRVARTIADLDDRDQVSEGDMAEALSFRAVEVGSGV
jgi:magnesium chelatase family protein